MLKKHLTSRLLPALLITGTASGLIACSGNDTSSTSLGSLVAIKFETVDKVIVEDAWTTANYKAIASLGYSSLVDNLDLRSAFLGHEEDLGEFLNIFAANGTFPCDIGSISLSQDDYRRAVFNACQLGTTLYDGELWTSVTEHCNEQPDEVTKTFTLGYKDYRHRQKLNNSTSYSQAYTNGEYVFTSLHELDSDNISDSNACPRANELSSKVVFNPQAFTQVEEDESETVITNASYEFQPDLGYVEYENLELIEDVPNSSEYDISGSINMNSLGRDIAITGTDLKYSEDGITTAGTLKLTKGNSEITLEFTSQSVEISFDENTTIPGPADASETIAQEDF